MKKLLFSLAIVGILGACSVDKRLYRPGYNIKWNNSTAKTETNKKTTETPVLETESVATLSEETLTASTDNSFVPLAKPENVFFAANKETNKAVVAANNSTVTANEAVKHYSKKELRKELIKEYKNAKKSPNDDHILLLVLLTLFVPFGSTIAVYLYEGHQWTSRVTTNLILSILCFLPGMIHGLVVILGKK